MSNFTIELKHKETKELHKISCMDNYFAHHIYGYRLPDERVLTHKQLLLEYEVYNAADIK